MVGASHACQSAGSVAAKACGLQGKAQSPTPGHHLLRQNGTPPCAHDIAIFGAITGAAPQKLLRKSGPVEEASIAIACLIARHALSSQDRDAGCRLAALAAIPETGEADPHLWG